MSSSSRKGSDAFLLSASHKDSLRRNRSPNSLPALWAAQISKLVTGEEDQSTGSIILAVLVVLFGFFIFWLLGGQAEPSSASQEVADLEAKYRLLLSSHKEVLKELDGLQKHVAQPDAREKELKALHKELNTLSDKYNKVEAGGHKFSEVTGALEAEVARVKAALHEGQAQRAAADKTAAQAQKQVETLWAEARRLSAQLNATAAAGVDAGRLEAARAEAVQRAVQEAVSALENQKMEVLKEAAAAQSQAVEGLKAAVREDLVSDMRALLSKLVDTKVEKEMQSNRPALSFSPFGSKPDPDQLEQTVKTVLAKIYEQRLGQVDWLLEINGAGVEYHSPSFNPCKAGGVVHQVRCQISLQTKPVQLMPSTLLKVDWSSGNWWSDHSGAMLGNCWAMNASAGYATLRLRRPVRPETFVMQHVPPAISPDQGGSAPHRFRVVGWLAGDKAGAGREGAAQGEVMEQRVLVEGEYQISGLAVGSDELMRQIQYFPVKQQDQGAVNRVRLEILSNHGKAEYTCLYHMRMYGAPA